MGDLTKFLENNRAWAERVKRQDPAVFESFTISRKPKVLWIGCVDHRIPVHEILGISPGDLILYQTIANQADLGDQNIISLLHYAVDALQVEHIFVCGHYGCNFIQAVLQDQSLGPLDSRLHSLREIYVRNAPFFSLNEDFTVQRDWLSEQNVTAQVRNLCTSEIVQKAREQGQNLAVHGLVFDPANGLLRNLDIDTSDLDQARYKAPRLYESDDREGILIIGAGPTARLMGRVLARSETVWLVDANADHCTHARNDGLQAVQGNALDERVLAQAQASRAQTCLVMTQNPEVNALAVCLARETFSIPSIHILSKEHEVHTELEERYKASVLFSGPVDLTYWDYHVDHGEAITTGVHVKQKRTPQQIFQETGKPFSAFPLAIYRNGKHYPFHSESTLMEGDRIILLRMRETRFQPYDRFDRLIWKAVVLDIDQPLDASEFFELASVALAPKLNISPEELAERFADREKTSSTVILPGLAVPHVLLDGKDSFYVLLARCRGGVLFPGQEERVHTVFVLAGTNDQRNTHLRALAAIANLAQWDEFELRWLEAPDAEALRNLVVHAPRRRLPEWELEKGTSGVHR